MEIARILLSVLVAVLLLGTGGGKVLRLGYSQRGRIELGLSQSFWILTGTLELLATIGLIAGIWLVPLGLAAAVGVVALMIGALSFRLRTRDPKVIRGVVADLIVAILAVAVVVLSVLSL
jgi:hypothetical protein